MRLQDFGNFTSLLFARKRTSPAEDAMPHITSKDGTRLYYEESGAGTPVVFVHEFAGDYRTWEPQMRHFSRSHRCVTYSQRGYPPSDVPENGDKYLQNVFRDDVIALMDALKIDKAHVVGHSMGAATSLHVGIHHPKRCISVTAAGCGYGSSPDPQKVEESRALSRANGKMFAEVGMEEGARQYADGSTRQSQKNKDPRGYAHFVQMLSEHSARGHSLTMLNLQAKRPTLHEMEAELKKFAPPLLVIVGDEDEWCVDASIYLRRTVPTAGLLVVPRTGHTITSEEPEKFNAALEEFFAEAERGRWLSHKPQ
jgi:pimeloyl-ACP methyl ester carboxylesterase